MLDFVLLSLFLRIRGFSLRSLLSNVYSPLEDIKFWLVAKIIIERYTSSSMQVARLLLQTIR